MRFHFNQNSGLYALLCFVLIKSYLSNHDLIIIFYTAEMLSCISLVSLIVGLVIYGYYHDTEEGM